MEVGKRTRLDPEQRRAQLLDQGVRILAEQGLDGVTVEGIAERAGVSRALVFHYFASADDLRLAVVSEASAALLARTDPDRVAPAEGGDDLAGVLRAVIDSYVDYATENRWIYVSLLRGKASGDPAMAALFEETRSAMVRQALARLPSGYSVTPDAVPPALELAVRGWIAFVEEATITWLREPRITRDELVTLEVAALPGLLMAVAPDVALELAAASLPGGG
ncbi:TetR/AcrR family transcriptional regulator [Rhodococcus rhodnii]|uniref:TetR family transcriptional regulator n=2 Tax=Rhodococcus rhodnii TaxID=38312 RepID=R7WPZ7_9NOCA|nr:TetR/AcrR family transcriptional regulator [Rhodococcus rhodnii]EOM77373.1 TetR family transcriptional regulator [Rhodococcus rhodnii LMG 5362]TXG91740.1 TetR/AcrR family transcriptional regulator [Rhodococcus rhodnii]